MRSKTVMMYLMFSLLSAASLLGQQCPNWSPKFNQITNQQVIQKLHEMNWDQIVQSAGGPEEMIASLKATRRDAQQRLDTAARAADLTKAYGGPVNFDVTWEQCQNPNMGANEAAVCEHLNMSEMILSLDGSIELLECRAGR
jgi:hypothetical protein